MRSRAKGCLGVLGAECVSGVPGVECVSGVPGVECVPAVPAVPGASPEVVGACAVAAGDGDAVVRAMVGVVGAMVASRDGCRLM